MKQALRRTLATLTGLGLGLLVFGFADVAFFSWDDWAALAVQRVKGPLVLHLVNATSSSLPVVDFGIGGFFCHATCVAPGQRRTCRPRFGSESDVLLRRGGPVEHVPVRVRWRSHGSVDLVITDAGIEVSGALDDTFP